jgi:hypothetical protein
MKRKPGKKKPAARKRLIRGKRNAKLSGESIPDLIDGLREARIRELAKFAM